MKDKADNVLDSATGILTTAEGSEITIGSPEFYQWLEVNKSFRYESGNEGYRVRLVPNQHNDYYWNAFKKVDGKLVKKYIGKSLDVTRERLAAIAKTIREPKPEQSDTVSNSTLDGLMQSMAALAAEVSELRNDINALKLRLEMLGNSEANQETPDYHKLANEVLNDLRLGKQSQAGKALDRFIKQIQKVKTI